MPPSNTEQRVYLYVGVAYSDIDGPQPGWVAQFQVQNDGRLMPLNPFHTRNIGPSSASAVSPSNQHLLIFGGPISEFSVGKNGRLASDTAPTAQGNAGAFTPNGQFVLVANSASGTLSSYSLDSLSGSFTPISTVPTGGWAQYVVVDKSSKFAYVSNANSGAISEYTISSSGLLAANGSVASGGDDPRGLVISPSGFLYCANANSSSVTQYSIDASTGTLVQLNTYMVSNPPQGGPLWISLNPAGTYLYVGNVDEIAQFTVELDGTLTGNGATPTPALALWGAVDPSGKFLYAAEIGEGEGNVSVYGISDSGALIPEGSFLLGKNLVPETLVLAER
jgi:6-phosphogluconolactonase (cycloisomerase 2 family)